MTALEKQVETTTDMSDDQKVFIEALDKILQAHITLIREQAQIMAETNRLIRELARTMIRVENMLTRLYMEPESEEKDE